MALRSSPLMFIGVFLLGALNVLILVEIVTEIATSPNDNFIDKVEHSLKLSAQPEAGVLIKPLTTYQQILTHPLFSKTRKPFVPKPPAPPHQSKPINELVKFVDPDFVVGGIIIHGKIRQAFLFKKESASGVWLSVGEEFFGWKLESIGTEWVKLQNNDHAIMLELYAKH
jgi:hypothetical protein